MFLYFFFFALNIITILFKITNQKDIFSLSSNNSTLLNLTENDISNDIQLLEISYNDIEFLINVIKQDPKGFANLLINNQVNSMIKGYLKTKITNEKFLDLIMDIKTITTTDNQTKQLIVELFDDIEQNKSSLDYVLLLANETNGYKKKFSISYDFARYHENMLKKIIEIIKNSLKLVNDVLYKFTQDNEILIEELFSKIFRYHHTSEFLYKITDIFLKNETIISEACHFFENTDIKELLESLSNIEEFFDMLPIFQNNENLMTITSLIFANYIILESETSNLSKIIANILRQGLVFYIFYSKNEIIREINSPCAKLLNYTLLGNINEDIREKYNISYEYNENISEYYINKLVYDSTKNKNDILRFENCIKNEISDDIIKNNPAFLSYLIDMTHNFNKSLRNGTYFEDFYFILGFCLPQGFKSEDDNIITNENETYFCEDSDYIYIMHKILRFFFDVNNEEEIISVELKNDKNSWKNFYNLIPFFIFLIPIIINLFLKLYNIIILKKKRKVLIVDQSKKENFDNGIDNNANVKKDEKEIKKVKIFPKWYNVLNEFVNFKNNYKELFDFDSEETKNHNTSGLVYIKGLMGISILLIIMGQLYLTFFNLPMKEFGQYQFYRLINNILYIYPFIGLRYSPRIIFSCSGFILAYKLLAYLKRGAGFYHIFKFIFRQLYKYLILINIIFFAKFSLNVIFSIFFKITPMIKIFNKIMLTDIEFSIKSILNLFTIKSYFIDKREQIHHNLMDYYWIAFNEIFYFIFGTILISIGYVCKLRFDFFIIFLALSLYIGKIIFYYIIKSKETYFYTTLYYYLFDFGIVMTNPLFNLSYFLIGMYFGLINYSIQKGIIDINENSKIYNQIHNNKKGNRKMAKINELIPLNNRQSYNNTRFSLNLCEDEDKDEIIDDSKTNKTNKTRKKTYIINKNINDLFTNSVDNNELYSENDNILNDKNTEQNCMKKVKEMPFLKSTINIIKWHRNHEINFCFIILIFFISLFIVSFIFINYLFLYLYKRNIKNSNEEKLGNHSTKLSLVDFITNPILNFIYLIDTEIFVVLVHWLFFILFMKRQYFFINFFSHIYWSYFMKSYFSFLMISNLVILYNFYSNETVVKLNSYNLFLYYFINSVIIEFYTIIFYIIIELPLKKLFKYMVKKDYNIGVIKEINEEEEEEEEEDENEDEEKDDNNEDEDKDKIEKIK